MSMKFMRRSVHTPDKQIVKKEKSILNNNRIEVDTQDASMDVAIGRFSFLGYRLHLETKDKEIISDKEMAIRMGKNKNKKGKKRKRQ